jgi:hypothetical protein
MPIRQFDKMAGQDQDNYVGDLIIVAVKTLLDGLGADDGCDPEKERHRSPDEPMMAVSNPGQCPARKAVYVQSKTQARSALHEPPEGALCAALERMCRLLFLRSR